MGRVWGSWVYGIHIRQVSNQPSGILGMPKRDDSGLGLDTYLR